MQPTETRHVTGIIRILTYLWPYRRKLIVSFIFGGLVALFWGFNLSAVVPVVEVLLNGKGLGEYVDQKVKRAEKDIKLCTYKLGEFEKELEQFKREGETDDGSYVLITQRKTKEASKLTLAQRKLFLLSWVNSYVMPWVPNDQFDTFALLLAVLLAATIAKGICIVIQDVLVGNVVELTTMTVRKECFRRALALDYQTLTKTGTPELMSRFTFDINVLSQGLTVLGGKAIREPLKAIVCILGAWLLVSWQLTLLSLLFAPLAGMVLFRIGRKLKQASHRMMEQMSRIYKTLEETFEASKIVIAFNGAIKHRQRFHRENKEYFSKAMRIVRIDALTSPTTEVMGMMVAFISVLPGAYLVLRGTTSIWGIRLVSQPIVFSDLALMYAFLAGTIDPARKLSSVYTKLKRSSAAADRLFTLIDTKPLVRDVPSPKPLPRLREQVEFKNVTFAFHNDDETVVERPTVLEGVNLTVAAGEVVVVVGENGSGKSTLLNLLPRYFDPLRGRVLIDGLDIRQGRLRDLRNQLGIVTQETLLFDDTIYENIRYGRPGATQSQVEEAARRAHVTQFVKELPEGFQTRVGEKGQKLSGGQRQRIAVARAMLRDPAILILDEATSAIDAQSEQLIHDALRDFVKGRTTFIITHSIKQTTLDFVSRIVVMDRGRLVATGQHEELLETCPVYAALFQSQSLGKAA